MDNQKLSLCVGSHHVHEDVPDHHHSSLVVSPSYVQYLEEVSMQGLNYLRFNLRQEKNQYNYSYVLKDKISESASGNFTLVASVGVCLLAYCMD